jgi:alkanesulfonate monooxygenase SsuD/methylene tetrahydromethanopterin reductase-like flavin-dependent oxidoreductase (luciferase family)
VAQLDALTALTAMAAVTRTIEIGTCILQVSPRNPAELANRAASLAVLSGGRLRLGVGPGSTTGDFDVVGADYENRFRNFEPAVATMRRAWAGEPVNRGTLTPWPGVAPPPLLLAAWRNPAWIERAARHYDGWIASGLRSQWEQLEAGMRAFRDAGGRRAVMANVPVEYGGQTGYNPHAVPPAVVLRDDPAQAKAVLRRLADIGFDDVLIFAPDDPAALARLRDLL